MGGAADPQKSSHPVSRDESTATPMRMRTEEAEKGASGKSADYENFWEAPRALWVQKEWTEKEIEAVMVGRDGPDSHPQR